MTFRLRPGAYLRTLPGTFCGSRTAWPSPTTREETRNGPARRSATRQCWSSSGPTRSSTCARGRDRQAFPVSWPPTTSSRGPAQGQASFVWEVLAVAGARHAGDLGPGVTCPSFRMHPAIVAQAAATLEVMYPGRTWLGLGSGEALNEHVVGGYWPEAPERINRMFEAIEILRKLFTGKDVKHDGRFFKLETTRLWTMPDTPPPIYIATAGPVTAKRTGAARRRPDHRRGARGQDRDDLREVPRRLPRGRQRPREVRSTSCSCTSPGRRRTSRRRRTPCRSGRTAV